MGFRKTILITIAGLVIVGSAVEAKELSYFESKIDYWNESPTSPQKSAPSVTVEPSEKSAFPWKAYLNPKNKEFFKEGDYTPPEPFMEIARDPSDENIKNWFEFMKRKNELASRLESRMQEYLAKNETPGLAAQMGSSVASREIKTEKPTSPVDPSRFKVRMYFDSHCPHCRRMFAVLEQLKEKGFHVEALQIDSGPVPEAEKVVPLGRADPEDLKKHGIKGVPYLLIADVKRKALLPAIEGYHDFEEVISLLRAASRTD